MKATKKKSIISKLVALCAAFALVFAMNVTAFAQITDMDAEDGTITVSGMESDNGATVTAYKVIDINFNTTTQQPEEPVYTWTADMATYLKGAGAASYGAYIGDNDVVTKAYQDLSAADVSTFYKDVIKANALTTAAKTATITNGTATMDVAPGDYLIVADKTGGTYQPMIAKVDIVYSEADGWTVADAEVVLKGSVPQIDKEVTDDDQTVAIGDTVNYKLTVDIPSYPEDATVTRFVVSDTLSQGLTLNEDSIAVTIGDETTELADTYYSLDTDTANSFTITMTDSYKDIVRDYPTAQKIYVTYNATVNANAFEMDALGNDAFLGYTNDPYVDSDSETTTEEDVYTYGIGIQKVDKNNTATPLPGAEFTLSDNEGNVLTFTQSTAGVYKYDAQSDNTTLTVAAAGTLQLQGLDAGTYTLKETKAPNGYVLPDNSITITILDDDGVNGVANGVIDDDSAASGENVSGVPTIAGNVINVVVTNTEYTDEGFDLPVTGGMGTALFTIAGIILMAGAVTMVVVVSKKKRA